ncbi:MAG: prolipoprotein diacylglyceryl transferase family protein, partial [Blautia sp.]
IIGRWGDFFNRDSFGYYTDGLSAMALPLSSVDYRHVTAQMVEHQQTVGEITFIQAHPAFLYEIIWNLVLLILILGLRRRKRFQGEVFFIYLTGYGLGRFWIEGIRTDQLLISGTSLGVSCVLSAILVVIGSFTIIARETMERKRAKVRRQVSEVEYAEFTEETNGSIEGEDRSLEKQAGQPSDQQGGHSQESGSE